MTLANYVTLSRIIFIPLVIALLLMGLNGLAVILFLILSASDALDGYIARRYNQVSDIGKFLDPLADKILVISCLIILVGLGKADSVAVTILVAREFIISGLRIQVARSQRVIAASSLAKVKTVVQIIAVALLILSLPYAFWVLWFSVVLSIISGGIYLWQSLIKPSLK